MKLDRYLFREILRPCLLSLAFYTFVFAMNQLFLVIREAFQRGSDPGTVAQILLMSFPKILVMTIPMAMLLGVLIGMGRLSSDSEVVALQAAGVSYFRMGRSVLALGLLGTVVSAALYNFIVPQATARLAELRLNLVKSSNPNREIRSQVFYDDIPGAVIYADEVVREDATWPLRRVFLYLDRGDDGQETFVCGSRGRIESQPDAHKVTLILNHGEIHLTDPVRPEAYRTTPFLGPFRQVFVGESFTKAARRTVQEMNLPELREEMMRVQRLPNWELDEVKAFRYRRALSEIHWRFSLPFAALAFSLLAFPLGLISHRGGKSSGFAISLIVIIGYWNGFITTRDLALGGRIPVWVGNWTPDIVILVVALALLFARQRLELLGVPALLSAIVDASRKLLPSGSLGRPPASPEAATPAGARTPRSFRSPLTILDRYLAVRFFKVFAFVLASVFGLYSVIELKTLLDSLRETHLPVSLAFVYLFYFTPGMLRILMPIAPVVAALVTLGHLCRVNEDTALKAGGISVFRISLPLLIVTACLCLTDFVVQDYVAPFTNQRAAKVRDQIEGRSTSTSETGRRWVFGKDDRLYGYAEYDSRTQTLQDVTAIDFTRESFTVKRRLWAPRVRWEGGRWIAWEGWRREFKDGIESSYAALDDGSVGWNETPEDFDRQERSSMMGSGRLAEEMNFLDLRQHIKRMQSSGYDTTGLRVSLYEKIAFPLSPFVMLLIGLPFAFRVGRRGSLYGLGIALFLVIIYWSSLAVSSALGQDGILPPLLAAFSPDLLFALAGTYFFLSTRS